MRSFFKIFFASTLGTLVALGLLLIIFISALIGMASMGSTETVVKENTILEINLEQAIPDRATEDPFANFDMISRSMNKGLGLNKLLSAIEVAKTDDNIKGIYLHTSTLQAGLATSQELQNALADFKTSGKFIYAYAESYAQGAYFLVLPADKIYMHPQGMLDFKGLAGRSMFMKSLFDKIGVEMQVVRHGKFKSAVEPFVQNQMSAENKLQMQTLLNSFWAEISAAVSVYRSLPETEINNIATHQLALFAEDAVKLNMVDSLLTPSGMTALLMNAVDVEKEKDLELLSINKYAKSAKVKDGHASLAMTQPETRNQKPETKIAVIYAQGEIGDGEGSDVEIGRENIIKALKKAADDDKVKAVVLRVNSPGGSAFTSEMILDEVVRLKAKKPVVVSMGNYAASGGYYISCKADKIYADPGTLTGSIGVFGLIPNAKKLVEDKIGLHFDGVFTHPNADFLDISRPMTTFEQATMQRQIERIYDIFIGHVAEGRKMSKAAVDSIGQGRVWSGADAQKIGLVDSLGGLKAAIAEAAKLGKTEDYRLVEWPVQKDAFSSLMENFGDVKTRAIKAELGEFYETYAYLKSLAATDKPQIITRMPYLMVND